MKNSDLSFLLKHAPDSPRVLLVSPHPDDEVIGAGSRLPLLTNALVLQVTDGSPADLNDALAVGYASREAYAEARHRELRHSLALCGLSETIELYIPDQQAAFCLPSLAERIERIINRVQPEYIITVPYEGGHPDHDATAFAVRQASARAIVPPTVIEMLSYHNENGRCVMDGFLEEDPNVLTIPLTPEEVALKRRLLGCFTSQQRVLQWFPVELEKFRIAPAYDFTMPPHPGELYYERFPWGMSSKLWCQLARRALASDNVARFT
jgi:LmbE family N-acetylglucosaminyl deacetylase